MSSTSFLSSGPPMSGESASPSTSKPAFSTTSEMMRPTAPSMFRFQKFWAAATTSVPADSTAS